MAVVCDGRSSPLTVGGALLSLKGRFGDMRWLVQAAVLPGSDHVCNFERLHPQDPVHATVERVGGGEA